jgi:hypothetical protein
VIFENYYKTKILKRVEEGGGGGGEEEEGDL